MIALDSVAHYLVDLQAETSLNQNVIALIRSFKDLQANLERLS